MGRARAERQPFAFRVSRNIEIKHVSLEKGRRRVYCARKFTQPPDHNESKKGEGGRGVGGGGG